MNNENPGVRFLLETPEAKNFVYKPPKEKKSEVDMEIIKSKRTFHSIIKRRLENHPDDKFEWPHSISFSEGMGSPIFTITIDKKEDDFFIDEKGQKWIKA